MKPVFAHTTHQKSHPKRAAKPHRPGADFHSFDEEVDIQTLIQRHGIKPIQKLEDMMGGFEPESDTIDEFLEDLRKMRLRPATRTIE